MAQRMWCVMCGSLMVITECECSEIILEFNEITVGN